MSLRPAGLRCYLVLLTVYCLTLFRQSQAETVSNVSKTCSDLLTCGECIRSSLGCRWCSDMMYQGARCTDRLTLTPCMQEIEDPGPVINITEDQPFSNDHQIKPQKIHLHLPVGKPKSFRMKVKPAAVFPLDVYFLMDLSRSMEDDLRSLQQLANSTIKAIRDITPDSTIGFGSFVDKPTEPYILSNLCPECVPAYSYSHALSLTKDVQQFLEVIDTKNISASRDNPEGSLDALYQSVVCSEIIGWRPNPTRKIVVLLTDHLPHIGGDGKISGSIKPHPRTCKLSKTSSNGWEYGHNDAVAHDYPSLSMLYSKLLENNIFVIFGVPLSGQDASIVIDLYSTLQREFPNRMSFAQLQADSSNINRRLKSVYNEITSKVQLSFSSPPELSVNYRCTVFIDGQCYFIGNELDIDVTMELKMCTPELENGVDVIIASNLFGELVVHVTGICDCQCSDKPIKNDTICNGNGDLVCGICQCYENKFGDECECDTSGLNGTLSCLRGSNGEECSGVGYCSCGQCHCQQNVKGVPEYRYYGDACECNNFDCGLDSDSKICSGHGTCECGQCVCDRAPSGQPYTGEICDCYPDDDVCRTSPEEEPCDGHGRCHCGECKCNHGFGGEFCQFCTIGTVCGPKGCKDYDTCVKCLYSLEKESLVSNSLEECSTECPNITAFSISPNSKSLGTNKTVYECRSAIPGDQCSSIKYFVLFETQTVYIEDEPTNCLIAQNAVEPWIIAIPLIIGLILLALIILAIIKMILKYLDYLEYKEFEKDASRTKFPKNENPMYISAWQKFDCPVYAGTLSEDKSYSSHSKSQDGVNSLVRIGGSTIRVVEEVGHAPSVHSRADTSSNQVVVEVTPPQECEEPDYESIKDLSID